MNFPEMIRVRQQFDQMVVKDISRTVVEKIDRLDISKKCRPGNTVALACSSRGIANYQAIVRSTAASLVKAGLKPFIIPAMGSHGSATAEGQKQVLEDYGITESQVGAPVHSNLNVKKIGTTHTGIPIWIDSLAWDADHIVLINRIAPHTDFSADIEGGLMKLMAIGLGKQTGAFSYHQAILSFGYADVIQSIGRAVLKTGKVLFGVGIVENGYGQTARIGVFGEEEVEAQEKEMLKLAKKLKPALPFDEADIFWIQEMGKDVSGAGFDTKTVGRIGLTLIGPEPEKPRIKRIIVSDMTAASHGNAVGIGNADIITDRLNHKIDRQATRINTITGVCPEMGRIPISLPNDREAFTVAATCVGLISTQDLKIMCIENTKKLEMVEVSAAYAQAIEGRNDLSITKPARPVKFLEDGYLPLFSEW
jgi:hypothetical protein